MPPIQPVTSTFTNPLDQDTYRITTRGGYFTEFEDYQTPVGAIIGSGEPVLRIDNSGITIPPSGTFELSPTATIETTGADGSLYRIQTYLTNQNRDLSQNKATLIQRLDSSSSITQQTLVQTNPDGRITQISSIGTDGRVVGYSPTNSADPTVVDTGLTDINAIVARQMPGAIPPSPALSTPVTTSQQPDASTAIDDSGSGERPDDSSIDPTTTPRAVTVDPTTDRSTPILPTPDRSTIDPTSTSRAVTIDPTSTSRAVTVDPTSTSRAVTVDPTSTSRAVTVDPTSTSRAVTVDPTSTSRAVTVDPTSTSRAVTVDPTSTSRAITADPTSTPDRSTPITPTSDNGPEEEFFDAQEFIEELDNCPPGEELDYQVTSPPDLDSLNNSTVFDGQPPQFRRLLEEQVLRQPEIDRGAQLGQAALGFLTVLQTAAVGIAGIANTTCKFAIEAANQTTPLIGNTTTEAPNALEENSQAGLSTSAIVGIGAAVTLVASVAAYKVQQMRKESRKIKVMNSVQRIGDEQARVLGHLGYLDGPPPTRIAWGEALPLDQRNVANESYL